MGNGSGSGNGWRNAILTVVAAVAAAAIIGSYKNAGSQGELRTEVKHNTNAIANSKDSVGQIPVMAEQIANINEKVDNIKKANATAHKEIKDQMKAQETRILRAIERTR